MRVQIQSISMLLVLAAAAYPMTVAAQGNGEESDPAVFVMTNAADHNEVIAYQRANGGTLRKAHRFLTGGRGSGR